MKPVLTLDYSLLISRDRELRQDFVQQLMESLQSTGYVKLINHGFDKKQLNDVFDWSWRFFNQPLAVKKDVLNDSNPVRGYSMYGAETTAFLGQGEQRRTKDAKESFDAGSKHDNDFPNKWPSSLPGFQPFMETFYEQCETICLALIKAIEAGLNIHDECITQRCIPCGTDFRLTHYPAIPLDELKSGERIRIGAHVDFGVITLLFQDKVGGFEIEDRSNPGLDHFIPIPPSNCSEMLVNLGATMQRWTNDKLFGGLHRVTIPEEMKAYKNGDGIIVPARMSVGYLHKAKRNVSVGPLQAFVSQDNPAKYPDMTGLEYHQWCNSRFY